MARVFAFFYKQKLLKLYLDAGLHRQSSFWRQVKLIKKRKKHPKRTVKSRCHLHPDMPSITFQSSKHTLLPFSSTSGFVIYLKKKNSSIKIPPVKSRYIRYPKLFIPVWGKTKTKNKTQKKKNNFTNSLKWQKPPVFLLLRFFYSTNTQTTSLTHFLEAILRSTCLLQRNLAISFPHNATQQSTWQLQDPEHQHKEKWTTQP